MLDMQISSCLGGYDLSKEITSDLWPSIPRMDYDDTDIYSIIYIYIYEKPLTNASAQTGNYEYPTATGDQKINQNRILN